MNIEILQPGKMVNGGHNALRALPENVSLLDLLVRESIQNSLDAGKDNQVNVNFVIGSFNPECFNSNFEGIKDKLNELYIGDSFQFLAIKDWGTYGLTGPTRTQDIKTEDKGNFYKLIYSFGENQTKEAAGGSRGVGKTIFSRIGMGLVIYYSRIKVGDGDSDIYESRLIACLIESEKSQNKLLSSSQTGIAWWGKQEGESSEVVPLTDEVEIASFLKTFGLKPYFEKETGTTIIIPYIDDQRLLSNAVREDVEDDKRRCYWYNTLNKYIKIAIQRWYYPRLINKHYNGKSLSVSINDTQLEKLEPVFGLMQALYNRASKGTAQLNDNDDFINRFNVENPNNQVESCLLPIEIGPGRILAGHVAAIVASKATLRMLPPDNNSSPFECFDLHPNSENENMPLLAFTRKPGMIVAYVQKKGKDGTWLADVPSKKNDYILAQFVLNSNCYPNNLGMSLEEYVRTGELGDHNEWIDQSINGKKQTIIDRIKKRCAKALKGQYEDRQDISQEELHDGGHGRELAGILMPPIGYGSAPRQLGGTHPGTRPNPRLRRSAKAELIDTKYNGDSIVLYYSLTQLTNVKEFSAQLKISAEGEDIDYCKYEEMFLNNPFELEQVDLYLSAGQRYQINVDKENDFIDNSDLEMNFSTTDNAACYSSNIKLHRTQIEAKMNLTLKLFDKGVSPHIVFVFKLNENE